MSVAASLPSVDRLHELIAGMAGRPVLMLVDLVVDRFVSGSPKRISREAPVLILRFEKETLVPGGGANAVANVAALGGRPLPLGVVGADDSGSRLVEALAALGVPTTGIAVRQGYRTPTKVRILGGGRHSIKQQIVRYDIEDTLAIGADERSHFGRALEDWRGRARVAVLSDYGYGSVDPALVPELRGALAAGSTILCDSRFRLADFSDVDGATPNEEEALALLDGGGVEPAAAGGGLRERLGTRFLLITRGSHGMSLFEDGSACHIPIHGSDQVADVTGAGDTVIGAFALAMAAGATPLEAALLADYAGGIVVQKSGTATLTAAELAVAVESDPRPVREIEWAAS